MTDYVSTYTSGMFEGYRTKHSLRGDRYDIEWELEYITAFCGGRFACNFVCSWQLRNDVSGLLREEERRKRGEGRMSEREVRRLRAGLRKFFKAMWLAIGETAIGYYSGMDKKRCIHSGRMRIHLYEVKGRPMHWAAQHVYKMKKAEAFNNPNSNNDVAMFIAPIDWERMDLWKKQVYGCSYEYGVGW